MFKLDNFGVILFISFSYKKLLQCSFYENLKDWCKNRFFRKKIQKSLCITTKSLYTNSKFQTQFSRKLQRFRGCRKNKKCSIFHELSEYFFPKFIRIRMFRWYGSNPNGVRRRHGNGIRALQILVQVLQPTSLVHSKSPLMWTPTC